MDGPITIVKKTYTVPEAAAVLGVSTSKMYQVIRMEGFPVIVLGKRRIIPIKALDKWLEEMALQGWQA